MCGKSLGYSKMLHSSHRHQLRMKYMCEILDRPQVRDVCFRNISLAFGSFYSRDLPELCNAI